MSYYQNRKYSESRLKKQFQFQPPLMYVMHVCKSGFDVDDE